MIVVNYSCTSLSHMGCFPVSTNRSRPASGSQFFAPAMIKSKHVEATSVVPGFVTCSALQVSSQT